jgi:tetratricopeptide (TPR) repeat protein
VELGRLFTAKDIVGEMHPEGITDPPVLGHPLFIHYDKSKDQKPKSVRRRQLIGEGIIPDMLSQAASQLAFSQGQLQALSIPKEAQEAAALIEDSPDLPLLTRGYKAVVEKRFDDARRYFQKARALAGESGYQKARADSAMARAEFFSGNFSRATVFYEAAGSYNSTPPILAETGVSTMLSGDLARGEQFLLSSDTSRRNTLRSFQDWNGSRNWSTASTWSTLGVAYAAQNEFGDAMQATKKSVALSGKLSKTGSSSELRTAAFVFANAAEVARSTGDNKTSLKFFDKSEILFTSIDETSPEYATMLRSHADVLQEQNKPELARTLRKRAASIEAMSQGSIEGSQQ